MIIRWIARQLFRLLGWKIIGDLPDGLDKAVLIMAPHTSNWHSFYGMTTALIKQVPAKFAIKKEALFFPIGAIIKRIGAISIDRKQRTIGALSQVEQLVNILKQSQQVILIIAPEGTRKYAPRWKTGFYHMAIKANVPIILGYLDYAQKHAGIGPVFYPTGNIDADIQAIQAFYLDKTAKYPDQGVKPQSPV